MKNQIDASTLSVDEIVTLAKTMYGEARGEGKRGMLAVGLVMRNRLWDGRWPDRIGEVCTQPEQYSCWNQGDPNEPILRDVTLQDQIFVEAMALAMSICAGFIEDDITNGADHYITTGLYYSLKQPLWAANMRVVAQIGNHVFLR